MQKLDVHWVMSVIVPKLAIDELQLLRECVQAYLTSAEYQEYQKLIERRGDGRPVATWREPIPKRRQA